MFHYESVFGLEFRNKRGTVQKLDYRDLNDAVCKVIYVLPGAIIGDGDRKSWDPRAPMIWDNFSIFRTNCAILMSHIRADARTCRRLSRGCCRVAWSNGESWETSRDYLAYFSQRWQGIRQGIRTRALICSYMLWANGKGGFFRVENKTSISRWEWIIRSVRASFKLTRMFLRLFWLSKKTLYSGIELICEFLRQWLIITKTCFDGVITKTCFWWCLFVSACLVSLQKFLKGKSDAYN